MSDIITKYSRLVDLLEQKTKEAKIPWEYDSLRKTVSVWNGDILLNLRKSQDENYEDTYAIALFNKAGDFIEGFDDTTFSEIEIPWGQDNYYKRMYNLYTIAMRQATGADKALDDFIRAIDNDDLDITF